MDQKYSNEQFKKIVVNPEHELTDLIGLIMKASADKILITFAESSDLLVSPVNFKVLLDVADENSKVLVAQIIQNPAGERNALHAGILVTKSIDNISDEMWVKAAMDQEARIVNKEKVLKGGAKPRHQNQDSDDSDTMTMDVSSKDNKPKPLSAFQQSVRSALDKSGSNSENKSKQVSSGGVTLALDGDIGAASAAAVSATASAAADNPTPHSSSQPIFNKPSSLIGRDFISKNEVNIQQTADRSDGTPMQRVTISGGPQSMLSEKTEDLMKFLKTLNYKKLGLIIVLPLLLISIIGFYYYYTFTPLVNVEIFIESKEVAVDTNFIGETGVLEVDVDQQKFPVKKVETISKTPKGNANATGSAEKGAKAGGVVSIKCFLDGAATLPANTTLTSSNGKAFKLVNDVTLNCPGFSDATVVAAEIGDDYNLSSDQFFTVAGQDAAKVNATNPVSFKGGEKETFRVVSAADIKKLSDDLKADAEREAEESINNAVEEGWELIESTISHKIVGDIKSDVPAGTEAEVVNVEFKLESTALYYNKSALEAAADRMLLKQAQEQDLFSSDDGIDLDLNQDDIQIVVKVEKVEDSKVTVSVKAIGEVKPTVSRSDIVADLQGKSYEDGIAYLEDLKFTSKESEVTYKPDNFPEGLRYFPKRQGRLQIKITQITSEVEAAE